jgi:hypothetical protein
MSGYLRELRSKLRGDRLYSLLAVTTITVVAIGCALVAALALLPGLRACDELSARVESSRKALADAQRAQSRSPDLLRQRVATAEARRREAARILVSEELASELPTRLYQYASESGVQIVSLLGQPGPAAADKGPVSVRSFDLQALGPLPRLVSFVSRIGEAGQEGFVISNMNILQKDAGRYSLAMSISLYTSPYAGAPALQGLATPVPTPLPPTPSPTATPTPAAQPAVYIVRSGDTLFSIARRYGTTVEAIMAANGMEGTTVRAGEQLLIPVP